MSSQTANGPQAHTSTVRDAGLCRSSGARSVTGSVWQAGIFTNLRLLLVSEMRKVVMGRSEPAASGGR